MKDAVAVITARGGSKRIPRKNIKDFCGKPIIAYSIEAALKSEMFDEIMVSTDDEEIAEIAKKYGAVVPFMRSEGNSDDYATTADVLVEVLKEYENRGKKFENMCCIYPTAPFVTDKKIIKAMQILNDNPQVDAVIPVVKFSFPPQRGLVIKDNKVQIINPDTYQMRSQDFEANYHECGQYYCMRVERFLNVRRLVLKNTIPIITSEMEVQDIDDLVDWEIAEIKYRKMIQSV